MYNIFKNSRGHKDKKPRQTATPFKKDKKKLDLDVNHHTPNEIHLEKPVHSSKPKEDIVILTSPPLCHGPWALHRRDSYSTITTIDDLEAASSSCVQSQITELSDGIPHFISFLSFPDDDDEDFTLSASNMPLIQKAKKILPDSTNVGYFYGDYEKDDDHNNDIDASAEFTMIHSPNPHTRKSPKQLLNQMDSFTNRNDKRGGRPALRRGESMGLNALSPPLRAGTLSPPLRPANRVGRGGRMYRLEI